MIDTGPATFELTVDNRGNVHRRFEEGTQLLASDGDAEFPFENFTVLGDSTRVVQAVWPDPPLLCWCTVDVAIRNDSQYRRNNIHTGIADLIADWMEEVMK